MLAITSFISIAYAPTIPLTWSIFADVADYSEWKIGRRFTGMVFATIGFALKTGLALGSACFLWIMAGFFNYDTKLPEHAPGGPRLPRLQRHPGRGLFAICTVLLAVYQLNKQMTIQMADELAERRESACRFAPSLKSCMMNDFPIGRGAGKCPAAILDNINTW